MIRSLCVGLVGIGLLASLPSGIHPTREGTLLAQSAGRYTPPRTRDGKPDIQGIWQVMNAADVNIQDHPAGPDGRAGHGVVVGNEIPYQPWALKKKQENYEKRLERDPVRNCFMPGVPRGMYMPFPFQIVQAPGHVVVLHEYVHAQRRIYTNGTAHQPDIEFWMGDSRGRWEGDTLVVDVTNFNGQAWFDRAGNFHSNELHVVERFTRTGPDHMQYEATIEDPKVFTKPWTIRTTFYRNKEAGAQLFDYQCYAFDHDKKGIAVPLSRMGAPK